MDIIKNPILLGVVAAFLTYLYLWYTNKNKKDKKSVSIFIPFIVGVIVCVIAYCCFWAEFRTPEVDPLIIPASLATGGAFATPIVSAASVPSMSTIVQVPALQTLQTAAAANLIQQPQQQIQHIQQFQNGNVPVMQVTPVVQTVQPVQQIQPVQTVQNMQMKQQGGSIFSDESFQLLHKGGGIPNVPIGELPDVFIETFED